MKRMFLLFIIIGMCLIVAIGGTMTFINSNSVLKQENQALSHIQLKNIKTTVINVPEDKTHPIPSDKNNTPSPKGEDTKGQLIDVNSPWGKLVLEYLYRHE